tara:strand:+ start:41 stop:241 length:201 start_codon:yes stop_codon:yes gene_type:complete
LSSGPAQAPSSSSVAAVAVPAVEIDTFCFLVGFAFKLDAPTATGATDSSLFIHQEIKERDDKEEEY